MQLGQRERVNSLTQGRRPSQVAASMGGGGAAETTVMADTVSQAGRSAADTLRNTFAALTSFGRSSTPEPHVSLTIRRRSSVNPYPDQRSSSQQAGVNDETSRLSRINEDLGQLDRLALSNASRQQQQQQQGAPPHTALTLAQRRRSSTAPLAIQTRGSFLSRFLPERFSPTNGSSSPPGSASSISSYGRLGGTPPRSAKSLYAPSVRRRSSNRDLKDGYGQPPSSARSDQSGVYGGQRKFATNRQIRRYTLRVAIGVAFLLFFYRRWRGVIPDVALDRYGILGGMHRGDLPDDWSSRGGRRGAGKPRPSARDYSVEWKQFRAEQIWAPPESELDTSAVEPTSKHEETVIFVHGLAQHHWDSPMPPMLAARFPSIRWVMPQAPLKQITVRQNETVPAWFDMQAFPYVNELDEDPDNLYYSARELNGVIRAERTRLINSLRSRGGLDSLPEEERMFDPPVGTQDVDGAEGEEGSIAERQWASSRIVLAGFSQGAVMTLLTGLTTQYRLAGLVLMSGFMPLRSDLLALTDDLDRHTLPVFWGHGERDEYLLYSDAVTSVDLLRAKTPTKSTQQGGLGLENLEFHRYAELEHTWIPPEMDDIAKWLDKVLPSRRLATSGTRRVAQGRNAYRQRKVAG